ncbi:fas apoptotic inhibitory molecule 1 isoform X2 [Aphidius gifuensis]|uniref:fas apoptotic inhibitory molecule 1 isoform X2 n=1 Tax=Aphidius gifuensis TaxID=684658 RepID=UPI001CDD8603|nr:fas apoptotic inhibitory molecule 1 isoform X2 [Aphidius gifuensis]
MAGFLLRSLQELETSMGEPTAKWIVPLSDGNHVIEFDHGTATGRRVVKIDGKIIVHREWMFRLVGDEIVMLDDTKFIIRVDPIPGFKYSYTLFVNGKSFQNFIQSQSKILESWVTVIEENKYRIVLDKTTQEVWINGEQIEVQNEFIDGGAEILFVVDNQPAVIRCCNSESKIEGIKYTLYIDEEEVTDQGLLSPAVLDA